MTVIERVYFFALVQEMNHCSGNKAKCTLLLAMTSLMVLMMYLSYPSMSRTGGMALLAKGLASINKRSAEPELRLDCEDVLQHMTQGRWIPHKMTSSEEQEMKLFLLKTREERMLPPGLQRPDSKCGNVTLLAPDLARGELNFRRWTRALCDPDGKDLQMQTLYWFHYGKASTIEVALN